jgi:hypothetical protein
MAGSISKVTARKKAKPEGKSGEMKHKHPVRHAKIMPADNGGFNTEIEMHPEEKAGENAMYQPGAVMTGAHPNLAQALKHVKGALDLKTDAQEQGEGEQPGGDPGTSPDAE